MSTRNRWHTKATTPADLARKRKYNSREHKAARRVLAIAVANGAPCWRCGQPITGAWHVGHDDDQPNVINGPEHPDCNRKAAARKGSAIAHAIAHANAHAATTAFVRPVR